MKVSLKQVAIDLRSQGRSIGEIASEIKASKGSISAWVKDVELSPPQLERLREKRKRGSARQRSIAQDNRRTWKRVGYERVLVDEKFRVVCALYWGEGTKTAHSCCITNTDADLIRVFYKWLVNEGWSESIKVDVAIHNLNEEDKIRRHWSDRLGIASDRITIRPASVSVAGARKRRDVEYGTARCYVCNVELLYKVLGGIEGLKV